jgi:hypothetical protein
MTLRQYIPPIGKSIKMREWSDYTSRDINAWSWLRVTDRNSDGVVVQVLNGSSPTSRYAHIPYSVIDPPIGWKPRYTIHVSPDKVETVLGWFTRGIVVRQSHDMSGSMPTAFQPMDNSGQPHWQFCEVTDAVPAKECSKVFRVVQFDRQEINFVPSAACKYCAGTKRRNIAQLAIARQSTINRVHDEILSKVIQVDNYDPIDGNFDCHCRYGGFRNLGRSKRAKLIKEWAKDGWETHYIPYAGGYWERTREIVVRDWSE